MDSSRISETVYEAVARHFAESPDQINASTRLVEDLGADSASFIELLTLIEARFGIDLTPDAEGLAEATTVGELAELISARIGMRH